MPEAAIDGVELKELVTHADERGFFREIVRETDPLFEHFGQWSNSLMYPGVTKAWHVHRRQTDLWYCIGALKVALYDTRGRIPHDDASIGYDWTPGAEIK
jgi:dTDP-4-dehydrorhamnose 3,5-epimerase